MSANLENSAVATGLEKVSFHSSPKEELLYDPEISLLDVCPKELKVESQRNICTTRMIAAFFTIAKTWEQPKCPVTSQ